MAWLEYFKEQIRDESKIQIKEACIGNHELSDISLHTANWLPVEKYEFQIKKDVWFKYWSEEEGLDAVDTVSVLNTLEMVSLGLQLFSDRELIWLSKEEKEVKKLLEETGWM